MKKFRNLIKSNKGVSLVELVVGMAILAIIGATIAVFMKSGSMSYASTSKEVNLQYDAQLVTNQINDILTEANGDISFYVGSDEKTSEGATPSTSEDKMLTVVTSTREVAADGTTTVDHDVYGIQWQAATKNLWYHKGTATYDSAKKMYVVNGVDASSELLAEKVELFTADLEGKGKDEVSVTIHFSDGKKIQESVTNVALRNAPTRNAASIDWSAAGGGAGGGGGGGTPVASAVNSVRVKPSTLSMKPGSSYKFNAEVKTTGGAGKTVTWDVIGADSIMTSVDGAGNLTIGAGETASKIYVRATSTVDTSKMDSATVAIQKVERVTVTWGSGSKEQNGSFVLNALVEGMGISTSSATDQQVRWTIIEGSEYLSQTGSNSFKISGSAPEGTALKVKATSVIDTSKESDPFTVVVQKAKGTTDPEEEESGGVTVIGSDWPDKINRGGSGTLKLDTTKLNGKGLKFVVEMFEGKQDTYGEGAPIGSAGFNATVTGGSCTVNVLKTFNYDKEATIWVTAYVLGPGQTTSNTTFSVRRKAYVDKVSLRITRNKDKSGLATTLGEVLNIYYRKKGQEKIYYELLGIESGDVTWKFTNKGIAKASQEDDYFTFSAPNVDAVGKTRANAFMGSRDLGVYVDLDIKPGNVKFIAGFNTSALGKVEEVWAYVPYPTDKEINQNDYFNITKELGGLCAIERASEMVLDKDYTEKEYKNYFKLDNLNSYYCYYWYRPYHDYGWCIRDEIYKIIITPTIKKKYNGNLNSIVYGSAVIIEADGVTYDYNIESWGGINGGKTVLRYKPGIDTKWVGSVTAGEND